MKLERLEKLNKIVEKILEDDRYARENDVYLTLKVIQKIYPEDIGNTFENVMMKISGQKLSFESITRCRRKIQENRPELKDRKTAEIRDSEQIEFIEFNRN